MSPQGYKNMDLESQDPIFNANLGQDENLIWTKKLRCSHSMRLCKVKGVCKLKRGFETKSLGKWMTENINKARIISDG